MIKSCYIHIPFCKNICTYCDFCKIFYKKEIVKEYLKALASEIKENYQGELLKTLYVGGGTPSSLDNEELLILKEILNTLKLDNSYEFTFECNIEDISLEKLEILKSMGINRLSIGIESFNDKVLKYLGRLYSKDIIVEKINLAKRYFSNINVDLIYAVENQTLKDVEEDLAQFFKLDVPHISLYSLIIEEHTKLFIENTKEIDEELDFEMYKYLSNTLKKHGYNHYEISNYSKENFESKHNLVYWNNQEYYGFGAGASGYINKVRYSNTKSVFNYIKGQRKTEEIKLSEEDIMTEELILGLRKTKGVNNLEFFNKYRTFIRDKYDIIDLLKNGLLKEEDNNLFIPEDKLYLSNEILVHFIKGDSSNEEK